MMRLLPIATLTACLLASPYAKATIIEFGPSLFVGLDAGFFGDDIGGTPVPVTSGFENLSIVSSGSSSVATGSGSAAASISGWGALGGASINGNVSASLGPGPGSATASILNVSTFDLVLPEEGLYAIDLGLEVFGPLDVGAADSGFANWDLFLAAPGFGFNGEDIFGESQDHLRVNGAIISGFSCQNFFDATPAPFSSA